MGLSTVKVEYPVYQEAKEYVSSLLARLDIEPSVKGAMLRRASILVSAVAENLAFLDGNTKVLPLSPAEAVMQYRKVSGVRGRSGAFLEMGLDAVFRGMLQDARTGWTRLNHEEEEIKDIVAKLNTYLSEIKKEKDRNEKLTR